MFCFSRKNNFNVSKAERGMEVGMLSETEDRVIGIALKPLLYPAPTSPVPHSLSKQIREAIEMRDLQAVTELLAASDSLASDWDETPLHMCIFYYCGTEGETITPAEMDIINTILAKHPGILDHEECSGSTALHRAILSGHLEVVRALLDSGATSHVGDITALHVAVKHPHILKFFLDKDDVENIPNKTGCAPIHNAAVYDKVESVELLVEKFGEEQLMWQSDGSTLLHVAAQHGSVDVAKFLLSSPQHRSSINLKNTDGKTPLYLAAEYGHKDMASLLIKSGADLSDKRNKVKPVLKQISEKFFDPITFLSGVFDEFVYEKIDYRGRPKICVDYRVLTENDGNGLGQMKILQDLVDCGLRRVLLHPLPWSLLNLKMKLLLPVYYILIAVYTIFLVSFNIYIFRFYRKGASSKVCTDISNICIECYAYMVVMGLIYCTTCLLLVQDWIIIQAQGRRYFASFEYSVHLFSYWSLFVVLALEATGSHCAKRHPLEHDVAFAALALAWVRAWMLLARLPYCGWVLFVVAKMLTIIEKFVATAFCLVFALTFVITLYYYEPKPDDTKGDPLITILGDFPSTFGNIQNSLGLSNEHVNNRTENNKHMNNSNLDSAVALLCLIIITLAIFVAILWINFTIHNVLTNTGCGIDAGIVGSLEHQLDLLCSLDIVIKSALGKIWKRLLIRRRHYCKIENYAHSDKIWKVSFNVDDNSATPHVANETLDMDILRVIVMRLRNSEEINEKDELKEEKRNKFKVLYDVVVESTINKSQERDHLRIAKLDENKESVVTLREKINTLEKETNGIKESIDDMKESIDGMKEYMKVCTCYKSERSQTPQTVSSAVIKYDSSRYSDTELE